MKVAVITITHNDGFKFKEWCNLYEEYKDEIDLHIIVDNNSEKEYLNQVKSYFKKSTIIKRKINGGTTAAYNEGIKLALDDKEIDAIMLLANDIKMEKGAVKILYEYLYSDKRLGVVSPILLNKESTIVSDFGSSISYFLTMKPFGANKDISEITEKERLSETVLGGSCMAKREFYSISGLQDEKLFMYSDEVDTGIRAKKYGFLMGFTKASISWHNHINPNEKSVRPNMAQFLIARNKVYLARKHYGYIRIFAVYLYMTSLSMALALKNISKISKFRYFISGIKGAFYGLVNIMSNEKFI